MADATAEIETMENRYMRAWAQRDLPELKSLTARKFNLVVGSKPAVMLDRASWLAAAPGRFACDGYRFGEHLCARSRHACGLRLAARAQGKPRRQGLVGRLWLTDLWRKGRVRRRWRLVERVLSRSEDNADVPAALRSMQLWRR